MIDSVEMGARAIKMKVGAVPIREDVARVKAVREAIGPDVQLLIDANAVFTGITRRSRWRSGSRSSTFTGSRAGRAG
ncbi:MAG: enolase C-terminal domain-like protein [Thermomicrobiales bacterium]